MILNSIITLAVLVNLLFLIRFAPPTYRFVRDEYGKPDDFSWYWLCIRHWFMHSALPAILLFIGTCATLLLFWALDYCGYNNVAR